MATTTDPWKIAKEMGMPDYRIENIRYAAENNNQMQTPTAEKNAVYDAFQNYYRDMVVDGAQNGRSLVRPNEWKQSIYDETVATIQKNNQDTFMNDYLAKVNAMYDQQRQAQLTQYNAQRDQAVGKLNTQKQELAPTYAVKRNEADVVNAQNVQKLRELMAANGLNASGENVTSQVALGAARQGALNQLNLQEQQQRNDIDQRISDLNDPRELEALIAALEGERSRAVLDTMRYADDRSYQRERDAVSDQRFNQQWDYQVGRDNVLDNRYNQEWNYQIGRDQIGDNRWNTQWDYQKQQDTLNEQWRQKEWDYQIQQDQLNRLNSSSGGSSGGTYPVSNPQAYTGVDYQALFDQYMLERLMNVGTKIDPVTGDYNANKGKEFTHGKVPM